MNDPTGFSLHQEIAQINFKPGRRKTFEAKHEQIWNTDEMTSSGSGFLPASTSDFKLSNPSTYE